MRKYVLRLEESRLTSAELKEIINKVFLAAYSLRGLIDIITDDYYQYPDARDLT